MRFSDRQTVCKWLAAGRPQPHFICSDMCFTVFCWGELTQWSNLIVPHRFAFHLYSIALWKLAGLEHLSRYLGGALNQAFFDWLIDVAIPYEQINQNHPRVSCRRRVRHWEMSAISRLLRRASLSWQKECRLSRRLMKSWSICRLFLRFFRWSTVRSVLLVPWIRRLWVNLTCVTSSDCASVSKSTWSNAPMQLLSIRTHCASESKRSVNQSCCAV